MKQYTGCMMCNLVEYDGMLVDEENFHQLAGNNAGISHGICKNDLCGLEMALKGIGAMNTDEELPVENIYMFDDLLRIYDKN